MSAKEQKAIAINVVGGLGNQLFQIFTVLAYAYEHPGVRPIFEYYQQLERNDRPLYWTNLLASLQPYTRPLLKGNQQPTFSTYDEPEFTYKPLPTSNQSFRVKGYFQSPKYFQRWTPQIFRLIRLREQQDVATRTFPQYFYQQSIAVHFRLGDYKKVPNFHPILPTSYYVGAIRMLKERLGDSMPRYLNYFCEAEDDETVSSMIREISTEFPELELSWVKISNRIPDWTQLLLMSMSQHQIIANSSFSWFAGFINPSPSATICYPSVWFGPSLAHHDTSDMYPSGWVKINV